MSVRRVWERVCLALIIGAFAYGTFTHASDFVTLGWWPYRYGTSATNLFWNLLVFLDAAVVVLLLAGWRRIGLCAALTVMVLDVAINAYAWRALGLEGFPTALPFQAALLGLIVGCIGFLWRPVDA